MSNSDEHLVHLAVPGRFARDANLDVLRRLDGAGVDAAERDPSPEGKALMQGQASGADGGAAEAPPGAWGLSVHRTC
mgnify:CR=1 FL=1